MTISRKCSPYIIGGTTAPLRRADAKPTFVMMVDCSVAYHAQIRALMGLDVLIEMRWTEPNDYQPLDNPEQRADEWWARRRGAILAIPVSDRTIIAGYNEIGTEQAAAFCRFEIRRLQHLHNAGYDAAVGSWGVGHPDSPEYAIYAPLFAAMRGGDVLDFHEYASDFADIDNRWHIGRFTIPAIAANLGDWPIVVSEYGYDYTPDTNAGQPGWQHTTDVNGCLAMLRKGGQFYDAQPRVVGFAAFQMGSVDPKFYAFNMYGVWPQVVGEYAPAPPVEEVLVSTPLILLPPIATGHRVSWPYGAPVHYGIDWSCVVGTPIYAAIDGTAFCETQYQNGVMWGFGRYVRLEDGKGNYVYTAHLSTFAVNHMAYVHAGDLIGYSGNTGTSTGPHLHFEVRRGARVQAAAVDPTAMIAWPVEPEPEPEPLPNDEQGPPAVLAQKARWGLEQMQREFEAGNLGRAWAIRLSLIELMYRVERELS
jgi:hypothetical protein